MSRENSNLKGYMNPSVHCSTVYNSQNMEATQVSTDGWMNKEDMVHTVNEKEWNDALCNNIGPRDCHTKGSKMTEKDNIRWYNLQVDSRKMI